ncbi:transducin family protein / WD-40 repeat family protein [Prunus dulcis]|uniref:Transducin family protein / WD-40 repeat family protein n=1 Tax=Prunus dulcis TaxID=3755 RepID=A0A4Y1RXB3_PRUDU|nr:transducin family protein / WD-40 repeat family protein [Prunus dulcis]
MYLIVALQLSGCRFDTLSNWNNDDGEAMGAAKHNRTLYVRVGPTSGFIFDSIQPENRSIGRFGPRVSQNLTRPEPCPGLVLPDSSSCVWKKFREQRKASPQGTFIEHLAHKGGRWWSPRLDFRHSKGSCDPSCPNVRPPLAPPKLLDTRPHPIPFSSSPSCCYVKAPCRGQGTKNSARTLNDHKRKKMTNPVQDFHEEEEDDQGEVYLDEADIIGEVDVDDEDEPDDSMHIFTGHTGELYTVVCSPTDPTLVATGGGDDRGFLWKIGQGDWAFELQGHKDSVSSLAFSTDGQLLASGSLDGIIQIWDITSQNLKCTLEGPGGGIEWVRWHPRGHLVLAGTEDSIVWMWNADKGSYLNSFSGHGGSVSCGKTICTGSADATLRIWNPKSGENIHVVQGHLYHTAGLTCLAISSDSTLAVTGCEDGSIHVVNIVTGKVVSSLPSHSDSVECIELAPSFPWAAIGSMDNKLIIWDLQHSLARSTCDHESYVVLVFKESEMNSNT